jgi:hypothetical protein
MNNFHSIAGMASGVLVVVSMLPYILSTLQGKTKPHRVTWWVLCTLEFLMAANQFSLGGGDTIWLPLCAAIAHFTLALLSIRHGEGRWGRLDIILILSALFSIVIWRQFNSPLLALTWNIAIDFLGLLPTLRKARRAPETESLSSWVLSLFGTCLNLLAVEQWSWAAAILPLYYFFAAVLIVVFLLAPYLRVVQVKPRLRRRIERNLPQPMSGLIFTSRRIYHAIWARIHATPLFFWLYQVFVEERCDLNYFATRSSYRAYNKNRRYRHAPGDYAPVPVPQPVRRSLRHTRFHVTRPESNHSLEWL